MKRDDAVVHPGIERRALHFGTAGEEIFGWYHVAGGPARRDIAAVVCSPIGHEYTRSHRTVRHLCDRLARQGIAALRFDYHGTGDSPGSELDPDRVVRWQRDIRAA